MVDEDNASTKAVKDFIGIIWRAVAIVAVVASAAHPLAGRDFGAWL